MSDKHERYMAVYDKLLDQWYVSDFVNGYGYHICQCDEERYAKHITHCLNFAFMMDNKYSKQSAGGFPNVADSKTST